MATTSKANLVIPEVIGDYINATMTNLIKLSPLLDINTDLVGNVGDTITVPTYQYIGDAEDLAENTAGSTAVLSATTSTATVKKTFKAVEITDEALNSAYGDPLGESNMQLALAMASKVEADAYVSGLSTSNVVNLSTQVISKEVISQAVVDAFGENIDGEIFLFVNPQQFHALRIDQDFKYVNSGDALISGHMGEIYGVYIVVTNRIVGTNTTFANLLVKKGGIGIALKTGLQVEKDRDILKKTTVISADRHYTTYLRDASKVAKLIVDNPSIS